MEITVSFNIGRRRLWGRLATCGGLVIRLVWNSEYIIYGPIANRPQVANLPYKNSSV
jgi:hypothetical protein